jgi:hypothetical protein
MLCQLLFFINSQWLTLLLVYRQMEDKRLSVLLVVDLSGRSRKRSKPDSA